MEIDDPTVFVRDLLLPHADVLVDETGISVIGSGWQAIVSDLFGACAAKVRETAVARLRVTDCTERHGRILVIVDAFGDMPMGTIDFRVIRELLDVAETRSLRTCVHCGEPGVLRRVAGGFSTRCEAHAGTVTGRLSCAPHLAPVEVIVNALHSAGSWLGHDADSELLCLPAGWLSMFVELLAELSRMPGAAAGLRLLMVGAVCGRLELRIAYDEAAASEREVSRMRAALLAAGDAALFTCDVCGAPGRLRSVTTGGGVPAPRCHAHASLRSRPSQQMATCDRSDDPEHVISSVRLQWDLEGLRAVAGGPSRLSEPHPPGAFALYDVRDVAAALGLANDDGEDDDEFGSDRGPADTEQQARLRRLLRRGDAGQWRRLARPDGTMVDRLDGLAARAPHLAALTQFVRRHLLASITMDLPVTLPPVLLVGPPGVGKTFIATALSGVLGVPYRNFPMTSASHSDSIGGSHGVWRNASVGLVAKLLLGQEIGNGAIFVDEFDKVIGGGVDDPYRPFYCLLEPIGARRFMDAYLGFPIDASALLWIFAANETTNIPRPILDRLTVISVDAPGPHQLAAIARSVYEDCNGRRASFFPKCPSKGLVDRLTGMTPRAMRIAIEDAMTGRSGGAPGRQGRGPHGTGKGNPTTHRLPVRAGACSRVQLRTSRIPRTAVRYPQWPLDVGLPPLGDPAMNHPGLSGGYLVWVMAAGITVRSTSSPGRS